MSIIVQKFGGTSVATTEKILSAAKKAIKAQQEGHQVVMVVSAMGKNTDVLVSLAHELMDRPPAREMDMLLSTGEQVSVALTAMAIMSLGHKAVSLTGAQIGIRTDNVFGKARIISISTDRMQKLLDDGNIVIAAGFQGIDEEFNITTLGRGGSDTTAVSLAAVLGASCEIYTDVDGVYTADPRVVSTARKVTHTSYDEMLEMASLGAGVMHSRSIEFAKKFNVPVHVRSSQEDTTGTIISTVSEDPTRGVSGAAVTMDEARITLSGVPDKPGTSNAIFSAIARANITVDMIVQDAGVGGISNISFTVPSAELAPTLEAVQPIAEQLGIQNITSRDNVSKISVVGIGMAEQSGVSDRMFRALSDKSINIHMITTSQIKISVLVDRDQALEAINAVHQTFELDATSSDAVPAESPQATPAADPAAAANKLQGMEELAITDIALDSTQASISIHGVPDTPGIAATIFETVAQENIIVDMIIQSYLDDSEFASLSFTVQREDHQRTLDVLQDMQSEVSFQEVASNPAVAKLSVSGIGLRSHTGVAIRMFQSLAEAGMNIEMINTSEVRVNVVVDDSQGDSGLKALTQAFEDVMGRQVNI
ncbi:MAG: aspartate kinase [Pirellulaceae bacterium]|nr:aspartate kinase [Rhodopirellula sp.]MBM00830.1 aspartate kinase [Rhodopirellula sp.]MCH2599210.1 aspartate kinase [Pirellulales bacterium]|tara:strand:- start:26987 stop:28774 length:1788 start_codon:yes stop_codon:yes gene_type:complete